jgi:hypothetical protein
MSVNSPNVEIRSVIAVMEYATTRTDRISPLCLHLMHLVQKYDAHQY